MKKRMIAWILAGIMSTTALTGCQTATVDAPEWIEKEGSVSTAPEYDSSITLYDTADDAAETPTSCDYDDDYDNTYDFDYDNNHLGYDNSYDVYADSDTAKEAAYGIAFNESDGIACMPYPDPDYYGNDGFRQKTYRTVKENAFQNTIASPLSTFGADVDTASYASFRRMVNDGYRLNEIPAGSIRTEELVNYFNYPYQEPKYGDVFGVNASIIDCPWNRETKLVNLGIKAKEIKNTAGISSNIVFLIDISGSMNDYDKLPLLQMGISELVDQLDENDRVSIVTYASSSEVRLHEKSADDPTSLRYQKATLSDIATTSNEWMTLSIRYKQPAGEKSELLTYPISKECYTKTPTGDTLFAAYVAECGMILNRSPHIGKLSITDVVKQVSKLNLRDEYQKEFADLIEML